MGYAELGFSIGQSGNILHFSRHLNDHHDLAWVGWCPSITQVRRLVYAMTCPPEELPPIALTPQDCNDFDGVHVKFVGMARVPSIQALARNIAIARLEGKL